MAPSKRELLQQKKWAVLPKGSQHEAFIEFKRIAETQGLQVFINLPDDKRLWTIITEPWRATPGEVWMVNYCLLDGPHTDESWNDALVHNLKAAEASKFFYTRPTRWSILSFLWMATRELTDTNTAPGASLRYACLACTHEHLYPLLHPTSSRVEVDRACDLVLYWALYDMDKVSALALGRRPMLLGNQNCNRELPGRTHLKLFKPHLRSQGDHPTVSGAFGATVFLRNVEHARLVGRMFEHWSSGGGESEKSALNASLKTWMEVTETEYDEIIECEKDHLDQESVERMERYTNAARFKYYHSLVILFRDPFTLHAKRYRAWFAREAIRHLRQTTGIWVSVFHDGPAWHFLYYPFTPFFVLFARIIHRPDAGDVRTDLKWLETVRDCLKFALKVPKLEELVQRLICLAGVFIELAEKSVATPAMPGLDETSPRHDDTPAVKHVLEWCPEMLPRTWLVRLPEDQRPSHQKTRSDIAFDWGAWEKRYGRLEEAEDM